MVVGSVAYDGVQTPHGRVERMLGGACTYISLAASYFTPVKIVAVVGEDFEQEDADFLASRGIDLEGLERVPGKTFYWSGAYSEDMNDRTTIRTDLNVFAGFQPKLPEHHRHEPYLLLGNIQPSLQTEVKKQMNELLLAGGDTMNYWIQGYREELLQTIREWDFLLINDSEAKLLSGEPMLRRAAEVIMGMGPRILVIKRGEHGAVLFTRHGHFSAPGYLLDAVSDPTGAGDSFAGGFAGYLAQEGADGRRGEIDPKLLRRAVVYGSVMGSFCCEKFGVERFRSLSRSEVDERFQHFKAITEF